MTLVSLVQGNLARATTLLGKASSIDDKVNQGDETSDEKFRRLNLVPHITPNKIASKLYQDFWVDPDGRTVFGGGTLGNITTFGIIMGLSFGDVIAKFFGLDAPSWIGSVDGQELIAVSAGVSVFNKLAYGIPFYLHANKDRGHNKAKLAANYFKIGAVNNVGGRGFDTGLMTAASFGGAMISIPPAITITTYDWGSGIFKAYLGRSVYKGVGTGKWPGIVEFGVSRIKDLCSFAELVLKPGEKIEKALESSKQDLYMRHYDAFNALNL